MKKRDRAVISRVALMIIAFLLCSGMRVNANGEDGEKQPAAVLGDRQADGTVYVYVRGMSGSDVTVDSVQIGSERCNDMEVISPENGKPLRTLLLLDNSLSTGNSWGADAKSLFRELIDDRAENEEIRIVTYAKEMTALSSYSSDDLALKNVIEGIRYENQESYLRDVLYRLLEEVNGSEDPCFYRFVIVADGADHQEIAYTENELLEKLRESGVPVYSVGVEAGNNNKELERFFSYARQSGGQYWSVKNGTERSAIRSVLKEEKQLLCIELRPQRSLCDGSVKETKITFSDGTELRTSLRMPFASGEEVVETPTPTEAPTATPTAKAVPKEEMPEEEAEEEPSNTPVYILLAVIAVFSVLAIVFVIVSLAGKKKREIAERDKWNFLPEEEPAEKKEERTVMMGPGRGPEREAARPSYAGDPLIVLTDTEDPSKSFRAVIRESITIGRKAPADIVLDHDQAVSGRHCMIILRGGRYFLRDLGSSNKTYYNGDQVINETEIENGGILSVGKHRYRVSMKG